MMNRQKAVGAKCHSRRLGLKSFAVFICALSATLRIEAVNPPTHLSLASPQYPHSPPPPIYPPVPSPRPQSPFPLSQIPTPPNPYTPSPKTGSPPIPPYPPPPPLPHTYSPPPPTSSPPNPYVGTIFVIGNIILYNISQATFSTPTNVEAFQNGMSFIAFGLPSGGTFQASDVVVQSTLPTYLSLPPSPPYPPLTPILSSSQAPAANSPPYPPPPTTLPAASVSVNFLIQGLTSARRNLLITTSASQVQANIQVAAASGALLSAFKIAGLNVLGLTLENINVIGGVPQPPSPVLMYPPPSTPQAPSTTTISQTTEIFIYVGVSIACALVLAMVILLIVLVARRSSPVAPLPITPPVTATNVSPMWSQQLPYSGGPALLRPAAGNKPPPLFIQATQATGQQVPDGQGGVRYQGGVPAALLSPTPQHAAGVLPPLPQSAVSGLQATAVYGRSHFAPGYAQGVQMNPQGH
ncbi:hypothetical protein CEUSTIGMA_g7975.t1 [Chlamydomonas eustigma]|uniref:Uncharacterized protein n=1 Tax=Chlamydomonas eustigma TaxID=1157962 RepID=A0A250XBS4_9CHLO|nr:hypothetical protein CEUSTIGMA_g7975.t1 [Chlamydomonas eustigma]|eukprot:GAX80537.1 hypothetical protein CEUSTIGMA_g7975.t1 [Chlamydomonas eustigma]